MQKVYLLLRNNQQTGPYSLEELLQFDLKPFDLIWIEGKSAGWYYPQEIQALQPHLPFLKEQTTPPAVNPAEPSVKPQAETGPKKVFVSMPSNASKQEPTPKPSFVSAPLGNVDTPRPEPVLPRTEPVELNTAYSKSMQDVETDYMNWVYQKKTAKKTTVSKKGVLVACLMVSAAFAGWMILKPAAESPVKTSPEQAAFVSAAQELTTENIAEEETTGNAPVVDKKKKQRSIVAASNKKSTVVKPTDKRKPAQEVAVNTQEMVVNEPAPEIKEEAKPVVEEKKAEPVATETPKEKKKLRDKIADLFRKKPEDKKEEAKPVEEESGERRSVRREAGSNLAQMVLVKFSVPNDWMMGIKGAKATLTNRSSETIVKAVVEVIYYNDDNDVLDKKTITFGNIKSKQTQTVSVPDHQTATRLEYNVVSATGTNEPFASR